MNTGDNDHLPRVVASGLLDHADRVTPTDELAMLGLLLFYLASHSGTSTMSVLGRLEPILDGLSEDRIRQLIDFARFLSMEQDRQDWQSFGRDQLSLAYGPDESEYTEADIRPG